MSKKIANVVACTGDAHSNVHIDNCMICLWHNWGKIYTCPTCESPLKKRGIKAKTFACPNGHGMHYKPTAE